MTTEDDADKYEESAESVDAFNLYAEAWSNLRGFPDFNREDHPEAVATLALTAAVCRLCRILERPAADGRDVE